MHSLLSRPINCSAYSERSCAKLQTKSTIQYEKSVQLSESFAHRTSHQGKCPWNRWSSAPDIRHPSTDNFWIFPQNALEFMAPPCIGFGGPTMYWSLTSWPQFLKSKKFHSKQSPECTIQQLSFQKFSRGNTPGPSQREGTTPSRTQHPARPLTRRGAPRSWDPNLGPLNFSAVVALL